jgi:RNA polymerase sigma-70 factor, ECF subfamily
MNFGLEKGSESKLIAAILAGDIHLYHDLIRPYQRSVYSMSLSYMKNEEDAADVVQETFIKAFRNLWAFRGDAKFSTWLVSIALNEARSRLRRRAIVRIVSLDEPQDEETPVSPALLRDGRELPSEVVEREQIRKLLQRAIEKLPTIYRQVLLLRHIEEFNANDTAKILDISTSLVKVRLHRARRMLRRLLEPKLKPINTASKKMRFQ